MSDETFRMSSLRTPVSNSATKYGRIYSNSPQVATSSRVRSSIGVSQGPNASALNASAVSQQSQRQGLDETFSESFSRHELFFKQISQHREETFQKLQNSLNNANSELGSCREKSEKLLNRVVQLESMIDEERQKFKERIEAQRQSKLARALSNAQPSANSSYAASQLSASTIGSSNLPFSASMLSVA